MAFFLTIRYTPFSFPSSTMYDSQVKFILNNGELLRLSENDFILFYSIAMRFQVAFHLRFLGSSSSSSLIFFSPRHRVVDGSQQTRLFPEWRPVSTSAAVIRKQYFVTFKIVACSVYLFSTQITHIQVKFCYTKTPLNRFWRHLFCCA